MKSEEIQNQIYETIRIIIRGELERFKDTFFDEFINEMDNIKFIKLRK